MDLPKSFTIQLSKIRAQCEKIKSMCQQDEIDTDDVSNELGSFSIANMLNLDKLYNEIWLRFHEKRQNSGKPNLYFPVKKSIGAFEAAVQKDQLQRLRQSNPRLYSSLQRSQPFSLKAGETLSWLQALYDIAKIRHERDPATSLVKQDGLSFGDRDGGHYRFDHVHIAGGKLTSFKGHKVMADQSMRTMKIQEHSIIGAVMTDIAEEAPEFCDRTATEVYQLTVRCFDLMD